MSINPFGDPAEQLTAQFYAWEKRGRGWEVYPHPVELEPPFRPFERYVRVPNAVDDGRRAGLLLSVLTLGLAGRQRSEIPEEGELGPEPQPRPATMGSVTELRLLLPEDFEPSRNTAEGLVQICGAGSRPVSFELIARDGVVSLQMACSIGDAATLGRHLASLAPEMAVLPQDGLLAETWQAVSGFPLIADLGLSEEFMRTLRRAGDLRGDPLRQVIDALACTRRNEVALVQVIATPARQPWSSQVLSAVTDAEGKPFFSDDSDLVAQAKIKTGERLFACRMRIAARAATKPRTVELVRGLVAAFDQFSNPPVGNSLIALDHTGWDERAQEADLLGRTAHRSGMLLNAAELAALVHLPGRETSHTALERVRQRTKRAPAETIGHALVLGENTHLGQTLPLTLSAEQRSRHLYVIGGSGTGKSTLLLNLIEQDVAAGQGLAVLDPHGDLVDAVLGRIPAGRVEDVVLVDPADAEYPIGINVLAAHSELERTLTASDLVAAFRRQSTSWGDQMNAVFANAISAFLESSEGGTLAELRRFLVEKDYRTAFLRTVADEEVRYYWEKEFPLLRGNAQAPILTRLDAFLRPRLLRNIVTNRGRSLDFRALMDGRKILLVKLSQGAIGEENAYLLGALILSKLQQLALSRQDVDAAARAPFYVYLDEFQHLVTPTTATLLSGVRKYGLGLTMAHQNLLQLSAELVDSVFANAGTRICFRVGDHDAKKLADGFSYFEARDLQNLDTGQAIGRVGRSEADFNLATHPVSEVDAESAASRTVEIVAASRRQWTSPLIEPAPAETLSRPDDVIQASPELPSLRPERPLPTAEPIPQLPRPRATPVTAGRGGQQHKYLQALISRLGQDRGFRTTIEQRVLDGVGSVDVALEREDLKIACEVWLTTPLENEIKNAMKCLAAGYAHVVMVAVDARAAKRLSGAIASVVSAADQPRVRVVSPDQLPGLLDELVVAMPKVETVGGYRVKVRQVAETQEDREARSRTLHDVVARTLRRFGKT